MLGFAIHTASPQLGLMLQGTNRDSQPISRHQVWDLGRDVSSHLHEKMLEFIAPYAWQELEFIAVAKGPGGFTGTRIGVVAARTLAQQLKIPLFGVSSLAALGNTHIGKNHGDAPASQIIEKDIAIAMAAKREAVFSAIYRSDETGDWIAIRPDEVVPINEWQMILEKWEQPLTTVNTAAGEGLAESVKGVMEIAIARYEKGDRPDWSSVMPFYGQHPVQR